MKKTLALLLGLCALYGQAQACADYDPQDSYYSLITQEFILDREYFPFLFSYGTEYYPSDPSLLRNENIEQWQQYLGIAYADAYQLVLATGHDTLKALAKGQLYADKLPFATSAFVTKHKQALLYLAYAKYLEPYMAIITVRDDRYSWSPEPGPNVSMLDYNKVTNVLERSWRAETDQELKLRYGYQLVRMAHYAKRYQEAIQYFDTYVEPLKYRPAIYYYALNQKAGAQRGLGYTDEANYNFFRVFVYSHDLKASALSSMRFTENIDFENMLALAKTTRERNDAYMLVGYMQFSNPLPSLQKIVATSPDAIQAKVLMARTIQSIESKFLPTYVYCWSKDCTSKWARKQYPFAPGGAEANFLSQATTLAWTMADNPKVKEKDFWYITAAYLHFLSKDYTRAQQYVNKINTKVNPLYDTISQSLGAYIYLARQPKITPEVEQYIYDHYLWLLKADKGKGDKLSTWAFPIDLLANRYYLQGDYAKSFLMNNDLFTLENNPQMDLINAIDQLWVRKDKNKFEDLLVRSRTPLVHIGGGKQGKLDVVSYFNHMRGNIYLTQGDFEQALAWFDKVSPNFALYRYDWDNSNGGFYTPVGNLFNGYSGIPSAILGYNRIECYDCPESDVMVPRPVADFGFIPHSMNKQQLTKVLLQLQELAQHNDEQAAKANYLIGNFFYNTSILGYYRHVTRFDTNNGMTWGKYNWNAPVDIYQTNFYFKNYATYYPSDLTLVHKYLTRAYSLAESAELRAQVAFALSKWEQAEYYKKKEANDSYWAYSAGSDDILISDRKYFAELQRYKNTSFYKQVRSNCLYFDYYASRH